MKKLFLVGIFLFFPFMASADVADSTEGKILLQVESNGEAWYVVPDIKQRAYLGRPADAFTIMRELGVGMSEATYNSWNGYAPNEHLGTIFLRVEANGEAYYADTETNELLYLGRPADAFDVMRERGLGISNTNLEQIPVHPDYPGPETTTDSGTEPEPTPEPEPAPEPEPTPEPEPAPATGPVPTVDITMSSSTGGDFVVGDTITINWSSQDADTCTATGNIAGWAGTKATSGSMTDVPTTTMDETLTLTCSNQYGDGDKSVQYIIVPRLKITHDVTNATSLSLSIMASLGYILDFNGGLTAADLGSISFHIKNTSQGPSYYYEPYLTLYDNDYMTVLSSSGLVCSHMSASNLECDADLQLITTVTGPRLYFDIAQTAKTLSPGNDQTTFEVEVTDITWAGKVYADELLIQ